MSIGLKGSLDHIKDYSSIKWRLRQLIREIRYAWQRVWKGYDNIELWNMNLIFIDRYKVILKDYNENRHCLFNVPEEYRDVFGKLHFDDDETAAIIETMIFHLKMMDEDYVEKKLYGKNVYDDDYDVSVWTLDRCKRISAIMEQNKKAFMKLFDIFFWDLWD